jgi:hypothetical protein
MNVKNGIASSVSWNREQRVVAHHAIDSLRQGLQEIGRKLAELDADETE